MNPLLRSPKNECCILNTRQLVGCVVSLRIINLLSSVEVVANMAASAPFAPAMWRGASGKVMPIPIFVVVGLAYIVHGENIQEDCA